MNDHLNRHHIFEQYQFRHNKTGIFVDSQHSGICERHTSVTCQVIGSLPVFSRHLRCCFSLGFCSSASHVYSNKHCTVQTTVSWRVVLVYWRRTKQLFGISVIQYKDWLSILLFLLHEVAQDLYNIYLQFFIVRFLFLIRLLLPQNLFVVSVGSFSFVVLVELSPHVSHDFSSVESTESFVVVHALL